MIQVVNEPAAIRVDFSKAKVAVLNGDEPCIIIPAEGANAPFIMIEVTTGWKGGSYEVLVHHKDRDVYHPQTIATCEFEDYNDNISREYFIKEMLKCIMNKKYSQQIIEAFIEKEILDMTGDIPDMVGELNKNLYIGLTREAAKYEHNLK